MLQIELNNNELKGDDLEILLKNCPELYKIKIEKNFIEDLENLKCLADYKLKKISLYGNPITTKISNYREELFKLVPSLTTIDGLDREGNEVESTQYGEDEEEEEDDDADYEEAEEEGELPEEDDEGEDNGEDDDDDEDDDNEKPQKKSKD